MRGWSLVRAAGLILVATLLSPVSPLLLVGVPLALLLLAFRAGDALSLGIAAAILVLAFQGYPAEADTVWVAERGWSLLAGGGFVAACALWPRRGLLFRSIAAVGVAGVGVAVSAAASPQRLVEVDWWLAAEIRHAATLAYSAVSAVAAGGPWVDELGTAMVQWMEFQQAVYPAFLALATVAALGVAWYAGARLGGSQPVLGELREFRFSDHLVWLLVVGLVLLVLPLGGLAFRLGENATLFMGALYLVRGLAVLLWVAAVLVTSAWSAVLWAALAILLYPVVAGTAVVLGLSDTWLDLRGRMRRAGLGSGS